MCVCSLWFSTNKIMLFANKLLFLFFQKKKKKKALSAEGIDGWLMDGWALKKEEEREREEKRNKCYSLLRGKTTGVRVWGLMFKKRLHLNNPKPIRIRCMAFLSSLLPGICLLCFVLARLSPHILFVQAIHQICQARNSWDFLSLSLSLRKETLHWAITCIVIFIWLSVEIPLLHSILNTLLTIKCAVAIRGFYFF